jgi:DNA-binding NtrC family response regulator
MPHSGAKRILIVDDERVIADTLVTIFSKGGFEAKAAYSAEEALHLLEVWTPDHAILDVVLPEMNGVDLAIRLKAEYPNCTLTIFSGQGATGNLVSAAHQQGHRFDVLAKPVHPTVLLRHVTPDLPAIPPPPPPPSTPPSLNSHHSNKIPSQ